MKIENFIKILIIILGAGLSYLKYNFTIFLNFHHLGLIIIGCTLFFILGIYILNKKVYGLKPIVVNQKLSILFSNYKPKIPNKIKGIEKDFIKPYKSTQTKKAWTAEALIWTLGATLFGVIMGYAFKTFDSISLYKAELKKTEWQSQLHLEKIKSKNNFFELKGDYSGGFDFNWIAFIVGIIVVFLVYFLIKKTTLFSVLKSKIEPYLK